MAKATLKKDDILEAIGNMSVLELAEMVKDMEEKFGVTAAAPVAAAPAAAGGAASEAEEEKDSFDVVLTSRRQKLRRSRKRSKRPVGRSNSSRQGLSLSAQRKGVAFEPQDSPEAPLVRQARRIDGYARPASGPEGVVRQAASI
jgi:hypothetical protein